MCVCELKNVNVNVEMAKSGMKQIQAILNLLRILVDEMEAEVMQNLYY